MILESMGQVSIGGLKFTDAKEELRRLVGKFYPEFDFSISLKGVREVKVLITGGVERPGLYNSYASQRVSEIIEKAGGLVDGASQRNIKFLSDRYEYTIDLVKFNRVGELGANPYLYSGHHLHIPMVFDSSDFIHVSGEVVRPGRFEFKEGDNLGILIDMSFGLTGLQGDKITIYGRDGQKRILTGITDESMSEPVRPGDKIIIGRYAKKAKADYIALTGEVRYPGVYAYNEAMTLQAAVDMAGGLTEDADVYSAGIYRLFEWEVPDSITDSSGDSLISRKPTGLYPLTLGQGITKAEFDRIAIVPGDSIYIPAITGSIGVYGLVKYPGQIVCVEPQSISSLIRQAGGFSPDADRKSIDIVRKTTGIKSAVGQSDRAFDGDVVLIKQREKNSGFLSDLRDAAIIVGAIGITYLALDNMTD